MRHCVVFFIAGAALSAAACAASPSSVASSDVARINAMLEQDPNARVELGEGEQRVVCRRERILGSNIPERVCRNVAAAEEDGANVRRTHRQMSTQTTGPRDPMASQRTPD